MERSEEENIAIAHSKKSLGKVLSSVNYMQVIEQTDEEKMAMYMQQPKEKLCEMLIQCNKIIDSMSSPLHVYNTENERCTCSKSKTTGGVYCDGRFFWLPNI